MKLPKYFFEMWVSQMLQNKGFLNDQRLNNSAIVGNASLGDLNALRELLIIYIDHANTVEQLSNYSDTNYKDSIHEVISMIDKGEFLVE